MEKVQSFINDNKQRYLDELLDMLRIPSVSADPKHAEDMQRMAENVRTGLLAAGVDHAEIHPTKGNPIVFGEKIIDPTLPTVLVYGHYDVQPADPINLWLTPPFEPTIKKTDIHPDGAIFGRVQVRVSLCEEVVGIG